MLINFLMIYDEIIQLFSCSSIVYSRHTHTHMYTAVLYTYYAVMLVLSQKKTAKRTLSHTQKFRIFIYIYIYIILMTVPLENVKQMWIRFIPSVFLPVMLRKTREKFNSIFSIVNEYYEFLMESELRNLRTTTRHILYRCTDV